MDLMWAGSTRIPDFGQWMPVTFLFVDFLSDETARPASPRWLTQHSRDGGDPEVAAAWTEDGLNGRRSVG